jgi:hypothetical protein
MGKNNLDSRVSTVIHINNHSSVKTEKYKLDLRRKLNSGEIEYTNSI